LKIPSHLAIIMDGNGRWAQVHGRDRTFGHLRGAKVSKSIIEHCANAGVKHLTLYAFSTENWLRPKQEVFFLMRLLAHHMQRERRDLIKNNIRFTTIGDLGRLPKMVASEVERTIRETAQNTGMHLVFALSYGARQELTHAVQTLAKEVTAGRLTAEAINENMIASALETADMPDPDLIIRTSGEFRLSNFLLWQAAYSELYVTDTLWPDFSPAELDKAFRIYSLRERRFGRTGAQCAGGDSVNETNEGFDEFDLSFDAEAEEVEDPTAKVTTSIKHAAP
jgi:undecaprenyl diphosphate synthase